MWRTATFKIQPFDRQMLLLSAVLLLVGLSSFCHAQTVTVGCPAVSARSNGTRLIGRDTIRSFTEVSGLVFSTTQKSPAGNPIVYAITDGLNDNYNKSSISGGRIGVFDSLTGLRLTSIQLPNATAPNYDWETMTLGSCGTDGAPGSECIYVGDVGDNVAIDTRGGRSDRIDRDLDGQGPDPYRIIKFTEPNLNSMNLSPDDTVVIANQDIWILPYNYFHESHPTDWADCEGIFIDNTGWGGEQYSIGDIYVVPKWATKTLYLHNNRLLHVPVSAWQGGRRTTEGLTIYDTYSPPAVGEYNEWGLFFQYQWTGADMSRDGTVISISNPKNSTFFLRCPGESVADALTGTAQGCNTVDHSARGQVETSAFAPDGMGYLEIPEGRRPRMGWSTLSYDLSSSSSRVCPADETSASVSLSVALAEPTDAPLHPFFTPLTALPTSTPTSAPSRLTPPTLSPTVLPSIETTIGSSFESTMSDTLMGTSTGTSLSSATNSLRGSSADSEVVADVTVPPVVVTVITEKWGGK